MKTGEREREGSPSVVSDSVRPHGLKIGEEAVKTLILRRIKSQRGLSVDELVLCGLEDGLAVLFLKITTVTTSGVT